MPLCCFCVFGKKPNGRPSGVGTPPISKYIGPVTILSFGITFALLALKRVLPSSSLHKAHFMFLKNVTLLLSFFMALPNTFNSPCLVQAFIIFPFFVLVLYIIFSASMVCEPSLKTGVPMLLPRLSFFPKAVITFLL